MSMKHPKRQAYGLHPFGHAGSSTTEAAKSGATASDGKASLCTGPSGVSISERSLLLDRDRSRDVLSGARRASKEIFVEELEAIEWNVRKPKVKMRKTGGES